MEGLRVLTDRDGTAENSIAASWSIADTTCEAVAGTDENKGTRCTGIFPNLLSRACEFIEYCRGGTRQDVGDLND